MWGVCVCIVSVWNTFLWLHMHLCVCVYRSWRLMCVFLNCSPLYLLRQGLWLNPEHTHSANLGSQLVLGILSFPKCWDHSRIPMPVYLAFLWVGLGIWPPGLPLAWEALYPLSHPLATLVFFSDTWKSCYRQKEERRRRWKMEAQ